ncbi:MAG: aldehyde ferredoxin oxidoreductase N-terminal domain-containing protein [Dehalococcoidia bacterium]|nr:aldehyde ferredoxin oxidoreductase N-terminal domain-containing protein [Dehalococcoidia bacterium]
MANLYAGRILRVNLTDGRVSTESTAPYAERFIGGKGINAKLLFDGVEPETRPFDPDNLLVFGVGALVGTPFPGASRVDVMAKSPVTGAFGDSGMGGYLGAELKFAGYDNIVIDGKADRPVYLSIMDDRVEIRDAISMWGHDTYETPAMVRQELRDQSAKVVCIGPAGENLVVYASILSGTGNAAARTGMGAVMGSKNLKAIAVRGTKGIGVARPREFINECKKLYEALKQNRMYNEVHKVGLTRIHDREMRGLYELLGNTWKGGESIHEVEFMNEHLLRRVGCFACPVACFDAYNIAGAGAGSAKCSPYGDLTWDLRNADLMVFWKAFVECQRYGLDARSLSNTLAWLMELHEHGIISATDTDGIPMTWGSPEAILDMARKISYREGIGDLLADGLPAAARKIGGGSEDRLLVVKGSPSDLHIVPVKTRALANAVSPIGEDAQVQAFLDYVGARRFIQAKDEASFESSIEHYKDRAEREVGIRQAADPRTTEGKAALVRSDEERTDICDMTGVCSWLTPFIGLPVNAGDIATALSLGSGNTVTVGDLSKAGKRLRHLERAFGTRCGLTRADDMVPDSFARRLRPEEPAAGSISKISFNDAELETMKDDYYRSLGWDLLTGNPTRETLEKDGLSDVADRLGL